jgi:effector-binding domain-containing protein
MPTTKERPSTRPHKTTTARAARSPKPTPVGASAPTVEIQTRAPEWALAIHTRASLVEIPRFMGEALPEVWYAAERLGLRPVMPFARYFEFEAPTSELEAPQVAFEAGVLVDGPVQVGEGRVEPVMLPGGEMAVACHVGPYERLAETYEVMQRWLVEMGRMAGGPMWEVYIDDPDTTPTLELRTEVVIPLATSIPID